MARKSSAVTKILVGLFTAVLFPTAATVLQHHYLGATGSQDPKDQGQKQSQRQSVTVTINTGKADPAPEKGKPQEDPQRKPRVQDQSRDLSGAWSGVRKDSGGREANDGLVRNDRPPRTTPQVNEPQKGAKPTPTELLPVVALKDLLNNPAPFKDKEFVLDRVEISGEIRKAPGHARYQVKVFLGSSEPSYMVDQMWFGFLISKGMGSQLLEHPSYLSRSTVKMTCLLTRGPKAGGEGKRWHVFVRQLDFLDKKGRVVKTVK
jgi:hypothetical protein